MSSEKCSHIVRCYLIRIIPLVMYVVEQASFNASAECIVSERQRKKKAAIPPCLGL